MYIVRGTTCILYPAYKYYIYILKGTHSANLFAINLQNSQVKVYFCALCNTPVDLAKVHYYRGTGLYKRTPTHYPFYHLLVFLSPHTFIFSPSISFFLPLKFGYSSSFGITCTNILLVIT